MIEAVLFDMDGVLVDTEPLHFATTNEVLERRHASIERGFYDGCTGMDEVSFFALLVERLGLGEAPERLARERQQLSLIRMAEEPLPPMPGALECLLALSAEGLAIAVASASTRIQVELVVGRLGIGRLLGSVVTADDVARGKPAPDLFLEAARRLGVPPAACLVVEDAVLGVEAAAAAGMLAVAIVGHEQGGEDHRRAGALEVLDGLHRLTPGAIEAWLPRRA